MSQDTAGGDVPQAPAKGSARPVEDLDTVVVRFAGDSGDGMQLTGSRFTSDAALFGNDLRTLPDFPAEIRAPAGTLAGVSSFQISFSQRAVYTPGDAVDALVAMNPAALKVNLRQVRERGTIIVNTSQFGKRNLDKAGFTADPLTDGSLESYKVFPVDISRLTGAALADLGLSSRTVERCKNFFALGLAFWLYSRTLDNTLRWIDKSFAKDPDLAEANRRALKAGYYYGDTGEVFDVRYRVPPARIEPGVYRNISGNKATGLGLVAAADRAGLDLFLGSYPITPASEILQDLAGLKQFGVEAFQAEDEIAGITSAIGAAFGGALAVTTTSGPGLSLKGEGLGLALMVELPLVVINVQRGGPSTGLPTKTEQADLFQALFGRNGEAPVPVLAAATPADCFATAYEAARIAVKFMTPVIVLTDGYIANGSEPWRVPDVAALPAIAVHWHTDAATFAPYARDPQTLARPWVRPGTPGLEHRIGGLEKAHNSGAISYDADNHERMVRLRAAKVARVADDIPAVEVRGGDDGEALLVGWGSTYGAILGAAERLRKGGRRVSTLHLRYLNPLPAGLAAVFSRFGQVIVPELNAGQLAYVLRATTLVDVKSICKVQGQPFKEQEIIDKVDAYLSGVATGPFTALTIEELMQ